MASAVQDLLEAKALLEKKGGLLSAGRQGISALSNGEPTSLGQVGATIVHDGRRPAVDLVLSAKGKYDAAACLVDGLPDIDIAHIQESYLAQAGRAMGGVTGSKAGQVTQGMIVTAASITTSVLSLVPVGLIAKIVKRRRTKKSIVSLDGMLQEYQFVADQLGRQLKSMQAF